MSDMQAATGERFALADVVTPTDNLGVDDTGVLTVEGCAVTDLVERFGSPLYVISEQTLRSNYRAVRDAFAARWPAEINVLYAIKANNNLAIRAVLHQEGAGVPFPLVQRGDILAVLDAGMYAETASTQLNGVPRPATVLVNGTQVEVVKERETVQDVFARHRVPPRLRVATRA